MHKTVQQSDSFSFNQTVNCQISSKCSLQNTNESPFYLDKSTRIQTVALIKGKELANLKCPFSYPAHCYQQFPSE